MDPSSLRIQLKSLIVRELNLEGRDPASIDDDEPLFGEGLGLDSLDALQLAMSIEEQLAVRIPEGPEGRVAFASVSALAQFIESHRNDPKTQLSDGDGGASGKGTKGPVGRVE
ncbi:MAG: hypothetical protein NVS3B20_26090 [Polyangiales bacterium]